ncbi:MAG: hypothetical protein KF849_08990 [Rhizobiaceae bacterium]|nr:hypothetical protein [Rhizobiaceae bacterium]
MTSGDASEWMAIVDAANVPALLAALRREGDLVAAIGGDADDELLARLAERFGPAGSGALDVLKTYLAKQGIAFEAQFWAGDESEEGEAPDAGDELRAVLRDALELVDRAGNDFAWSSWEDAASARTELASLIARLPTEAAAVAATVAVIFAPTGPLQELALSSGWTDDYLQLATHVDGALERLRAGKARGQ